MPQACPSAAGQDWAALPQSWDQWLGSCGPRKQIRSHLEEEARRFDDGWLHLYEYSPVTEHMHIQRE